jgi:hypothetical protein
MSRAHLSSDAASRGWRAARTVLAAAGLSLLAAGAEASSFQVVDTPSPARLEVGQLKPGIVYFSDRRSDPIADRGLGLARFEDWGRQRPAEQASLSLYPSYREPTINVVVHGLTKPYTEKLHVFVAETRFVLPRPSDRLELERFVSLDFVKRLDPAITHRAISASEVVPARDPEEAYNRHPQRPWCGAGALCVQSRYQLEGKLPLGIRLANKLEDSGKKIAEYLEFQSELRVVPREEATSFAKLTNLATPVAGALEQSIFHVNQMLQFGKVLAIFQPHPDDPGRTVVTAYLTLAVESDVLDKKREFESVPVLRNMVPSQVLVGASSFNAGNSISAGLPKYTRAQALAIANALAGTGEP